MRKANLLVVEDDPLQRKLIKENLEQEGYAVFEAENRLGTLEVITEQPIDVAIVDFQLDGETGLDVIRAILERNPLITPVMVTAFGNIANAVEAMRQGAYDYIRKPCKLEEIKIVVDNAIDKIKLNRENGELVRKLHDAYHELIALKKDKGKSEKMASVNFFSSNLPSLHYLYNPDSPPDNYIEKLQALSSLKENGLLTESEFKAFKKHLLKMVGLKG